MSIGYYLLYDLYAYILCIVLNYKNLQFKQFIDDIAIASMKDIRRRCNPMINLSKFTSNKKILSKNVTLNYN